MKRLIVCSDGTWNNREKGGDGGITNVVKISRLVAPTASDGTSQIVFYDPGVGTEGSVWDRVFAGVTGQGLSKNIGDAYLFLVENFTPGDEIYLFGFSRGAYTARSTVGLIRKCGLLRKDQVDKFQEAYALYRSDKHPDSDEAKAFRQEHSHETPVHFLGVWDTVGSLGIPVSGLRSWTARKYQFHDVALSKIVKHARHAVSIDERRKSFEPTLWSTKGVPGQTVEQVWFAGVHSGVGGGYAESGLSDVALAWMTDEAAKAGLAFDERSTTKMVHPDPYARLIESNQGFWSVLGGGWRTIGAETHQPQTIHPAALSRLANPKVQYQPKNLIAYLREHAVTPKDGVSRPTTRPVLDTRR
jgi:uncharacterized protein (DUF2235 family)